MSDRLDAYFEAIGRVRETLVPSDRGAAGLVAPVYRAIQAERAYVGRAAFLLDRLHGRSWRT